MQQGLHTYTHSSQHHTNTKTRKPVAPPAKKKSSTLLPLPGPGPAVTRMKRSRAHPLRASGEKRPKGAFFKVSFLRSSAWQKDPRVQGVGSSPFVFESRRASKEKEKKRTILRNRGSKKREAILISLVEGTWEIINQTTGLQTNN